MSLKQSVFCDADYEAFRCAAFVDSLPLPLVDAAGKHLGPKVAALTPWRHNLLFLYRSPFVMGQPADRLALIQALWLLSPGLRVGSRFQFWLHALRWRSLPTKPAIRALSLWIRSQFIDAPPRATVTTDSVHASDEPVPHWLASFIVTAASSIGMPASAILHLPYAQTLQYLAVIAERSSDGLRPKFNRARDRQNRAYMLATRARQASRKASINAAP